MELGIENVSEEVTVGLVVRERCEVYFVTFL